MLLSSALGGFNKDEFESMRDSGLFIVGILFLVLPLLVWAKPGFEMHDRFDKLQPGSLAAWQPGSLQPIENPTLFGFFLLAISTYFIYESFKK